jgi:hypothetical protein
MKQGWGDDYIPVTLTSSNSGWHKGWFYLRNDPEFALPVYTGNSIAEPRRSWSDGPVKTEQEKMLKDHWLVLRRLRGAGICEMTANRAPWTGTVTAPSLPSPLEVQRRVMEAIGRSTYLWPPSRLLLMLPSEGT